MSATKRGNLLVKVRQVNITEQVNTLWSVKFCPKVGVNLLSLKCKLLQGNKISSDHNIVGNTLTSDIILDHQIKTCDGWVAGVNILQDNNNDRAVSATALPKRSINNLHVELCHSFEKITLITTNALSIQVTSTFKLCEDFALHKANQCAVSKKDVPQMQILGEGLIFNISSPSTPTFDRKLHWLLVIEDCSNYSWSLFLKENPT